MNVLDRKGIDRRLFVVWRELVDRGQLSAVTNDLLDRILDHVLEDRLDLPENGCLQRFVRDLDRRDLGKSVPFHRSELLNSRSVHFVGLPMGRRDCKLTVFGARNDAGKLRRLLRRRFVQRRRAFQEFEKFGIARCLARSHRRPPDLGIAVPPSSKPTMSVP